MPRIAIVGGGIAGLAVAYELGRLGHRDFALFEASHRYGGIVETVRQDGFVIECGPDSWVTEKPWARELAVELGLEADLISSNDAHRRTYLLEGDTLVPMPDGMRMMVPTDLEAIERSPLFTQAARQAYREEPRRADELKAFAAAQTADWDESVAGFVERHFGREVADKVAGPLLAGVFGGDIRKLSATAVMAPFVQMEREHGSLILALQRMRRGSAGDAPVFTTLRQGLQSLIDGMVAAIPSRSLHPGEPVRAVTPVADKWEVATTTETLGFDRIVLAAPVHIVRGLVAPWAAELASLLEIDATSSVVAAFAFDREQSKALSMPEGFGFLVPQSASPTDREPGLLACTFTEWKFPNRVPQGCVLLRAFFGGDSAPLLLDKSDDFIRELARRRLSRALGNLPAPRIAVVRRWPRSLPQYTVGHRARVARIESIAARIPGMHLIGNAFHGVGLPDLIRQGRQVARGLLLT